MTKDAEAWGAIAYCLMFDRANRRVLAVSDASGHRPPHVAFASDEVDLHEIVAALCVRCGHDVRTLRVIFEYRNEATRQLEMLLHCEDLGPVSEAAADCQWASVEDTGGFHALSAEMRDAIHALFFDVQQGIVPAWRRPWECQGWHARAEAWIKATAEREGYIAVGPVDDYRAWSMTRMLRLPTDKSLFYFKASGGSRLFASEALVTEGLATLFPAHVPAPLAIVPNENWMLTPDFGNPIGHRGCVSQRANALKQFAALQIEASGVVERLVGCGCLDRRLPVLAEQISLLASATTAPAGLVEVDILRLLAAQPKLASLCARLATYRVPHTLVHGDLHMGNVALPRSGNDPKSFLFFDWTDACIAHPFMDLIALTEPHEAHVRERILASYLEPWTDFEPMARLREMVDVALPLIFMHQAISYRAIDDASEEPFMIGDTAAAAVFLRQGLDALSI